MNIKNFFTDLVKHYNETNKCGRCWAFFAPLSEKRLNQTKLKEEELCCTKIFLTYYKYSSGILRNPQTGLTAKRYCDYILTFYVVTETKLGKNTDREQPYHEEDESLYNSIIAPLEECIGCGREFEICSIGYNFDIFKWDMEPVVQDYDNNYVGWKVNAVFREYI